MAFFTHLPRRGLLGNSAGMKKGRGVEVPALVLADLTTYSSDAPAYDGALLAEPFP